MFATPQGKNVRTKHEYLKAWEEFSAELKQKTGIIVYGHGPHAQVHAGGVTFSAPVESLRAIMEHKVRAIPEEP